MTKKYLRKIIFYITLTLNIISVVGLIVCTYVSKIPPQNHPSISYWGLAFPAFLVPTLLFLVFWLFKNRKLALISAGGLLLCISSIRTYFPINFPSTPPEGALKVISYNLNSLGHAPNGQNWHELGTPFQDTPIIDYLATADADIVCCQEAANIDRAEIYAVLDSIYPYHAYNKHKGGAYCFLSKYPILSTDSISYPSSGNGSLYYTIQVGKDTVLVVNNHFESYKLQNDDREEYKKLLTELDDIDSTHSVKTLTSKLIAANVIRGTQVDKVAKFVEESKYKYIIVCGDFNDPSISYTHYRLTRQLNDCFTRSGNGAGISYNRSGMYFRIDNILCSPNIESYHTYVDSDIKTSDHYPIVSHLVLK